MLEIAEVQIGEVKASQGERLLRASALGSCIAVIALDITRHIGMVAHVMLPGSAPGGKHGREKTKYAANAIDAIIETMTSQDSKISNIQVALVGAGNVLCREDDSICRDNIESVTDLLKQRKLSVVARALGGNMRKSALLNVEKPCIMYTEGDGPERRLFETD